MQDLLTKKLKKLTVLANGYGVYRDMDYTYYYIAPEAMKEPRTEWKTFELHEIIYVYIEDMYG